MRRSTPSFLAALALVVSACAHAPEVRPLAWADLRYAAPEKEAEVAGHRVVYVDEGPRGDPEPIVFIHGLGGDLMNWRRNIGVFARAKRVLAVDLPGFGKSQKKPDQDYRPSFESDAVVALLDALEVRRATLVGNSMGGQIAAWTALRHPERVARLVLVGAAGLQEGNWFVDWLFSEERIREYAWQDPTRTEGFLWERMPEDYPETYESTYAISKSDPTWPAYAKAFRSAYEGIVAEPLRDRMGEIRAPTLLAWGEKDRLVPLENAFEFHRNVSGSLLAIFEGCGHVPQWECPDAFNAALANFLGVSLAQ